MDQTPEHIGRYKIVRTLGEGGMGIVYEGVHTELKKRVAIKTLRPEFVSDATFVERFLLEG